MKKGYKITSYVVSGLLLSSLGFGVGKSYSDSENKDVKNNSVNSQVGNVERPIINVNNEVKKEHQLSEESTVIDAVNPNNKTPKISKVLLNSEAVNTDLKMKNTVLRSGFMESRKLYHQNEEGGNDYIEYNISFNRDIYMGNVVFEYYKISKEYKRLEKCKISFKNVNTSSPLVIKINLKNENFIDIEFVDIYTN